MTIIIIIIIIRLFWEHNKIQYIILYTVLLEGF